MENLTHELEVAKKLALEAGRIILQHYAQGTTVEFKNNDPGNPVTQADRDANHLIVEGLAQAFPQDGILAEESPSNEERLKRRRLWCVDPLDGTRDFVAHNGQFVVMIGLAIEGQAALGVVYHPTEDILYWGTGAQGAMMRQGNAAPKVLTVSPMASTREATLMVSRSHPSKTVNAAADRLHIERQLPLGSVGLKVARVADATAQIYISSSNQTYEWDACGPEAIVRAAGGKMTDICGRPLVYNKIHPNNPYGMLATNGRLHAACVEALQPAAIERGWTTQSLTASR